MSCRSPTSSLITPLGFFSRGAPPPPPVFRPGHGDVTYPLHHGQGLEPTLVTSLGPGRQGSRPLYTTVRASSLPWSRPSARAGTGLPPPPAAARLLAHPAPATGPAWLQRIPPGSGAHTVRLPLGTGHGKGPCPARARIGFPKSSWSRPQRASTVYRSRQSAPEPCLTRPPADSTHGRHKARCALQSIPFVQLSWRRTLTGTGTDRTT